MSKKKEKVNEISTTDEGTKLVKIIVIILILFAIFYDGFVCAIASYWLHLKCW